MWRIGACWTCMRGRMRRRGGGSVVARCRRLTNHILVVPRLQLRFLLHPRVLEFIHASYNKSISDGIHLLFRFGRYLINATIKVRSPFPYLSWKRARLTCSLFPSGGTANSRFPSTSGPHLTASLLPDSAFTVETRMTSLRRWRSRSRCTPLSPSPSFDFRADLPLSRSLYEAHTAEYVEKIVLKFLSDYDLTDRVRFHPLSPLSSSLN